MSHPMRRVGRALAVCIVTAVSVVAGVASEERSAAAAEVGTPVCAAAGSSPQQVLANAVAERSGSGWSGGDGSASVRTSDGRILWFFGDSWIGAVSSDGTRDPATAFVSSTIGIEQGLCVTFTVRRDGTTWQPWWSLDGNPQVRWWPMAAFESGGKLYVTFLGYDRVLAGQYLGPYVGAYITVWDENTLQLLAVHQTPSDMTIQWGLGFAAERGQLYVYGVTPDTWPRQWYLAKWDGADRWQYQTKTASWSPLASRAAPLANGYRFQSFPYVMPWQGGVAIVEGRGLWHGLTADFWWAPSPTGPYRQVATGITSVSEGAMPQPYEYLGTALPLTATSLLLVTNTNSADPSFFAHGGLASYVHAQAVSVPPVLHVPDVVLGRGARGAAVVQLQSILKVKGYGPTMVVDGRYGTATAVAVRRLQLDLQRRGYAVTASGTFTRSTAWVLAAAMMSGRL